MNRTIEKTEAELMMLFAEASRAISFWQASKNEVIAALDTLRAPARPLSERRTGAGTTRLLRRRTPRICHRRPWRGSGAGEGREALKTAKRIHGALKRKRRPRSGAGRDCGAGPGLGRNQKRRGRLVAAPG